LSPHLERVDFSEGLGAGIARYHTIKGVHSENYQCSDLMKNGHIESSKAAVEAIAMVTRRVPHQKDRRIGVQKDL